jgi:NAD+ synthase (glutamine-hydrolysing)
MGADTSVHLVERTRNMGRVRESRRACKMFFSSMPGRGCVLCCGMSSPGRPHVDREAHGFVRAAVVSPELALGDVARNETVLLDTLRRLAGEGCRVVVFPELCLTGYSCADLFHLPALQQQALAALRRLAEAAAGLGALAVIGLPLAVDGRLYNMAAVLGAGRVLGYVPKSFLPNSGEFYERRWFSPAHTLTAAEIDGIPAGTDLLFEVRDLPGLVLGVEICEDLWTVQPPSGAPPSPARRCWSIPRPAMNCWARRSYRRELGAPAKRPLPGRLSLRQRSGPGESSTDTVYSGHSLIAENGTLLAESERFALRHAAVSADLDLQRLAA